MTAAARPWYREPMVWLIIALPLASVIAGLGTLGIAIAVDDGRRLAPQPLHCVETGNSKLPPDCR